MSSQGWGCRNFEAIHVWTSRNRSELRVTGEVECPSPGYRLELRPHLAQGFNELDLLVGLVVSAPEKQEADGRTWIQVEYRKLTETRYATITVTDCGGTIPVLDLAPEG